MVMEPVPLFENNTDVYIYRGTKATVTVNLVKSVGECTQLYTRTGYSIINELCRHNYGQTNLSHGRFRPEVLLNRYFCMMGVIGCVHKLAILGCFIPPC
jgi:hypothetical protein